MSGRFATSNPDSTETILAQIGEERERQDAKHGAEQDLPNGTGGFGWMIARERAIALTDRRMELGTVTWLDVLNEEFCEAMAEEDEALLRKELIQTAAVCVKWVEALDRKGA